MDSHPVQPAVYTVVADVNVVVRRRGRHFFPLLVFHKEHPVNQLFVPAFKILCPGFFSVLSGSEFFGTFLDFDPLILIAGFVVHIGKTFRKRPFRHGIQRTLQKQFIICKTFVPVFQRLF